jgi:hypothetical protein
MPDHSWCRKGSVRLTVLPPPGRPARCQSRAPSYIPTGSTLLPTCACAAPPSRRQGLTISAIEEPNPFAAGQKVLAAMFDHWKVSGIMTYGSERPANATVSGDPNQDGNTGHDGLSGYGRNALIGPDYASMDLKLGRKMNLGAHYHLELTADSFHLFNRDNPRFQIDHRATTIRRDSSESTHNRWDELTIRLIINNLQV